MVSMIPALVLERSKTMNSFVPSLPWSCELRVNALSYPLLQAKSDWRGSTHTLYMPIPSLGINT